MSGKPGFRFLIVCGLALIPGHVARADEPLASRRERIETKDLLQKKQLLERHKQFQAFTPNERERLRNLHREIESDSDRDELRQVMNRYYDWLKTLSSYELMELRKLSPEERIERIKALKRKDRARERGRERGEFRRFVPGFDRYNKMVQQISSHDKRAMLRWTAEYAAGHEDAFIESLPETSRRRLQRELDGISDSSGRMQVLFWRIWLRRQLDNLGNPLPEDDDWPRLVAALSLQAREILQRLPKDKQRETVSGMIQILALEHYYAQRSGSVPSVVSDKELADFSTNDLDQSRQSRLLGLPPAEMKRMAWRFYLISKLPDMPPDFGTKGPGAERRPGPQRRGPPHRGEGQRSGFGRPGLPPGGRVGPREPPPRPGRPSNHTDR